MHWHVTQRMFESTHTASVTKNNMVAVTMLTAITSLLPSYSVWITLSLLVISWLIYWFGVSSYGLISHVSLPGPKPWPYVGNLLETVRYGGLHKAFIEYSKKYGRVYKMYLGRDPIITVADPEILKHILVKDFDKFRNRPEFIAGNPPLDKGLFGARDDSWKRIRSIVTPTFSSLKLKEIVPIIQEAVDALMEKFENFAKNGKGKMLKNFHIAPYVIMHKISMSVVSCLAARKQHTMRLVPQFLYLPLSVNRELHPQ